MLEVLEDETQRKQVKKLKENRYMFRSYKRRQRGIRYSMNILHGRENKLSWLPPKNTRILLNQYCQEHVFLSL